MNWADAVFGVVVVLGLLSYLAFVVWCEVQFRSDTLDMLDDGSVFVSIKNGDLPIGSDVDNDMPS